jgi:hypothetical protein
MLRAAARSDHPAHGRESELGLQRAQQFPGDPLGRLGGLGARQVAGAPVLHARQPAALAPALLHLDPVTIQGVPVKPTLGFRSNEFVYAVVTFDVAHFPTAERFFVERYGPPTKQEQEPVPGPTGARVTNELRHWIGPKVSITLQKYGPTLTEGRTRYQFTAP